MEKKYVTILKYLEKKGMGESIDISPMLCDLYLFKEIIDKNELSIVGIKIRSLLRNLFSQELIKIEGSDYMLFGSITGTKVYLPDKINVEALITEKGLALLSSERNQIISEKLNESVIETNSISIKSSQSTIDTNAILRKYIGVQTIVASISLLIACVALYNSCKTTNPNYTSEIKHLDSTLQNRLQLLDSISQALKVNPTSIIKMNPITTHK